MAIGNTRKKFGENRTCSFGDMIADGQTHRQRQTDTFITILRSPIGGGVTIGRISVHSVHEMRLTNTPVQGAERS